MKITREQADKLMAERKVWRSVFCTPEGKAVLIPMLDKLGYFADQPQIINPEKIAFANWLLNQIGIVNIYNLDEMIEKLAESAGFKDIEALVSMTEEN